MKLLHLIYDHMRNPWVGGGGAVRAYEICRRLAGQGHEVTIVSGNYPGAADYSEDGLRFFFTGSSKNYILSTFSYAVEAACLVKKKCPEFDIVVEDFAPWNPLFSPLLTKKPVVLHVNHREGANILKRFWLAGVPFFLLERFYPLFFKHITALSPETRKKIEVDSVAIVPAGIDGNLIGTGDVSGSDESLKLCGRAATGRFLLYMGRLHIKNKGLDTLIVSMKGLEARLLIAGKGKDEDSLKQMASKFGVVNVDFCGFLSEADKIKLVRKSEALILPSRFEGWGIVVLEAAACGKPVIVSDIPELRYAVDAGFGISFKTGDAKDLARKIKFLHENDGARREMGQKAREYAKDYTWDKIALDYERFLLKITGG